MRSGENVQIPGLIGIDWGTSSFRAYLMTAGGQLLDQVSDQTGILRVQDRDFAKVLTDACGSWLTAWPGIKILMCGMIGSRGGWQEALYLSGAIGVSELSADLTRVPGTKYDIEVVPGLAGRDFSGGPDVMRGEETTLVGALAMGAPRSGCFCLPGTHSKWVDLKDGRICRFSTYLTGEMFALLREQSILSPLMGEDDQDWCPVAQSAFLSGVDMAAEPSGLLHQVFSLRAGILTQETRNEALSAKLSGLLIGTELAVLNNAGSKRIVLIAAGGMAERYQAALRHQGYDPIIFDSEECCRRGLAEIAAARCADIMENTG